MIFIRVYFNIKTYNEHVSNHMYSTASHMRVISIRRIRIVCQFRTTVNRVCAFSMEALYDEKCSKKNQNIVSVLNSENARKSHNHTCNQQRTDGTIVVREGLAEVLFSAGEVFYNRVQQFNRDMSVLAIQHYIYARKREDLRKKNKKICPPQVKQDDEQQNAKKTKLECAYSTDTREEFIANSTKNGTATHNEIDSTASMAKSQHSKNTDEFQSTIIEAFGASGLRSLRYAKEIEGIKVIYVNDIDPAAQEAQKANIAHNGLSADMVIPTTADATVLLHQQKQKHTKGKDGRPDVIDLDPYGSAAEFLDAAVQAIQEGGLLCVTCTDKSVLSGNTSEACFAKYGSVSLHGPFHAEQAVRIVLSCIEAQANRYKRYIVPLISISVDFYVRVFVRVYSGLAHVKRSASKKSLFYSCSTCHSFHLQPVHVIRMIGNQEKHMQAAGPPCGERCDNCQQTFRLGGPIWTAPIHDQNFVASMLHDVNSRPEKFGTSQRMRGVLTVMSQELEVPLNYSLSHMCHSVKIPTPKATMLFSALQHAGYKHSQTHCDVSGFKTDAPSTFLWDMIRELAKLTPPKPPTPNTPAYFILNHPTSSKIDFTITKEANAAAQFTIAKFLPNPEPHWGPKARANSNRLASAASMNQTSSCSAPNVSKTRKKLDKHKLKRARLLENEICERAVFNGECRQENCPFNHDQARIAQARIDAGRDPCDFAIVTDPNVAERYRECQRIKAKQRKRKSLSSIIDSEVCEKNT